MTHDTTMLVQLVIVDRSDQAELMLLINGDLIPSGVIGRTPTDCLRQWIARFDRRRAKTTKKALIRDRRRVTAADPTADIR